MAAIWNPRAVLNVYPDEQPFTCVGKAKSGLRCKSSHISREDISKATLILNRIATTHPRAVLILDLRELATLTLCPGWHRKPSWSQIEVTARNWMDIIRPLQTTTTVSQSSTSIEAGGAGVDSGHQGTTQPFSAGDSASSQTHRAPSNSRPRPVLRLEPTGLRTPPQSPSPLRSSPIQTQPEESPSIPTTTLPPLPPSRSSSVSSTLSILSPAVEARTLSEIHDHHPDLPPSPAPSSPGRTRSSRPVRKPITDPCPICFEPFCCPDDAVWCRAQCGQNVHRTCFERWRGTERTQLRGAERTQPTSACVYWYVRTLTFH
jgi:hypothetical protein